MSEEDTVRAPDQVDGKMDGDALIHPATDPVTGNVVESEAAPAEETPAEAPAEEKPAEEAPADVPVPAEDRVSE